MTVPVVICDDSAFARKATARALPAGWDVAVTFAANGPEAIEAVRAGRGDILLLDLTMPDMDGFEVLEVIRREDLPTMTIVISGDVQEESRARVRQLGAVAFLQKPVDGLQLADVLRDYGVLGILNPAAPAVQVEAGFDDWVQELTNVAMGRAADLLASIVADTIELGIPKVARLAPAELDMMLAAASGDQGFSLVSQGFIGGGISGETLLFFNDGEVPELARLMGQRDGLTRAAEVELLTEVGNVLVGAFLKGVADQLDIHFSQGQPLIHTADSRGGPLRCRLEPPSTVLTIDLGYRIGAERVQCDQIVLLTEHAIARLQVMASYALE